MMLLELIRFQDNDVTRAVFVQICLLFAILTLVVREIGASNDPLKPMLGEPSWCARLFCIWKPRRAVAWLPRIVYYGAFFWLLVFLPRAFADANGNFGNVGLAENRGSFLLTLLLATIAVSAKGAARAMEVGWPGDRALSLKQRMKSVLLLHPPWRRAGWAAAALFWLGLGALVALATSDTGTLKLLGWGGRAGMPLGILLILLVTCAWIWAQLYRPPSRWTES
jgi:hypothetical protein